MPGDVPTGYSNAQIPVHAMDILLQNIERTLNKSLPRELVPVLQQYVFQKSFEKKSLLAETGRVCRYLYFIEQGSCYSWYINENGDKHAVQFAIENYWITDSTSFFSRKPGIFSIEALEPVQACMLNRENFELLCDAHPLFDRFFRILNQNTLAGLHYRIALSNSEQAPLRYREFSERYPQFIQRIPQYLIASYLGIKPQSLSRIRKQQSSRNL